MSPCKNPKLQKEIEYQGRDTIESKPILEPKERELLMSKLNVKVFYQADISCDDLCLKNNMKCVVTLYPLVNNCYEFKKREPDCQCISEIWYGIHSMAPFLFAKYCVLIDNPHYQCHEKIGYPKLCACRE